jgi:O-antigen biosynthesis protein
MKSPSETVEANMCISILMPVSNSSRGFLDESIKSILDQSNPAWELSICGVGSRLPQMTAVLDDYRGVHPRIRIAGWVTDTNSAKATNLAAEVSTGNFVAFLEDGDLLDADAVNFIVQAIERNPEADVLYTDEDRIEPDGILSEPDLKPDWSPEHLLSAMYINHFMVVRKSLFLALGGLRPEHDGAQLYDLALRATAQAREVVHIPRVLYHCRENCRSNQALVDAEPAKRALADFVQTKAPAAEVTEGLYPGTFRVKWPIDSTRPVTLMILTGSRRREVKSRGDILLVENTVNSIIQRSSFRHFRVVVLDDGALPRPVHDRFLEAGVSVEQYRFNGAFNFARKINHAFALTETEDVILLNDDVEVIAQDWIEALLAFSRHPEVGAVGARLHFANDRLQHAGIVLGLVTPATHIFYDQAAGHIGYQGYTHVIRNYSAVTGAVLATRMSVVHEVGGFDTNMATDYNDVDFCLRILAAGYRVVYTPYANLYHFERSSIPRSKARAADQEYFVARWREELARDHYYNPRLPRDRPDCHLDQW